MGTLLVLNQQFKKQAIANIMQAQETIITELVSDIDKMSMRLSHLVYTNNNEILEYAAGTDTAELGIRHEYEQKLNQAGNLALEPVKDIVAVGFYMKDGKTTYFKNTINRDFSEIKQMNWYQTALENPNTVCVGSYDTKSMSDLFIGGKKDLLILIFALAPDVMTDRSQKVEMITFYQSALAAERIKEYNSSYLKGDGKYGITQITGEDGELVFSTQDQEIDFPSGYYTCVKSPLEFNDTVWYIESYIKTSELTEDFWNTARVILGVAILILMLAGYYSRYFLRSIVRPVEETSNGLKQVEEGNLQVHITPEGQSEIRNMIHQFNAMVRRLKVLIDEYEEQVKEGEKSPKDYLAAMINGDMTPEYVNRKSGEFFAEPYAILGFFVGGGTSKESEKDCAARLTAGFERNPRFASRCIMHIGRSELFYVFYRITEQDYISNVIQMVKELQKTCSKEYGVSGFVCIGQKTYGAAEFNTQIEAVRKKMCIRHLAGNDAIIDLNENEAMWNQTLELADTYEKLAKALYTADEKNMIQERKKMFEVFNRNSMQESVLHTYAAIIAVGNRFESDHLSFSDVFGQSYNYMEKIARIEDGRSLKLWLTNLFAWIMNDSATKLSISQTDVIVKAKRYIADNYEDADLSLGRVADYVDLNEKYFTNRFTKETGETFSSYLTGLRMQKAKELLKTTNFKVYEIAEMVGYHNVEHFNRMFKKLHGISPAQYRKAM